MIKRLLYVAIFGLICLCVYAIFIYGIYSFGRGFAGHNTISNPECDVHQANRISFNLDQRKLDLSQMIDSFQTSHPQYIQPAAVDWDAENIAIRNCCCIEVNKEILFPGNPREIYTINIERHRYHAGFEDQFYDDIGYIDIVSTYLNGKWQCELTSKLNSKGRERVLNRFMSEVLTKLPTIKDKSVHEDEKWLRGSN